MSRQTALTLGAAALGLVAFFGWSAARGVAPVRVGAEAPEFRGTTIDAPFLEKSLNDYRGNVVILNVWATWCEPCIVEMPSLEKLHRRYGAQGLRIVAVSVDAPGSTEQIRQFRERFGLTFDILHDAADVRATFQTAGVPESFVIGRDGRIRRRVFSAEDWDSASNRALVEQLLGSERKAQGVRRKA
ncbi:MAG: TlpA disulfide reductase family protein [Gemmatimonadota bacterium]